MNKVQKNLEADGFEFIEENGVIEFKCDDFVAYYIKKSSTFIYPDYGDTFGKVTYRGSKKYNCSYDVALCATVTLFFDYVDYTNQNN